ncbi:MAG: S41 family peptidase [Syntrophomonas sp.]|nr:S41 family peptidase [Syntrophomonas sp.]
MNNLKRLSINIIIAFLLIALLFPNRVMAQLSAQDEIWELLRYEYVHKVQAEVLDAPTIDAMLEKLGDPYTTYLTAAEYRIFNDSLEQNFSGIGIYLDIVAEGVRVTGLVSGSPAAKSDLRPGDIITDVNSLSLQGLSSEEVIPLIRGPEGSSIELAVLRDGVSFSLLIERGTVDVPSVTEEMMPSRTGYLRISSFASETGQLFAESLNNLLPHNPDFYIVDLRDNGGGYVNTAMDIAGYFISDNVAMQTQYRYGSPSLERAVQHKFLLDKPVIILINENSASASEILAGAVKDYGRAVILGTQSYGKGSMQQLYTLESGDYFKMTVAHFLSPLGKKINEVGIAPDLRIEKSDPIMAARLLLSPINPETTAANLVGFELQSHFIIIDTQQARQQEYWQPYGEILDRVALDMMKGSAEGWKAVTQQELSDRRSLYYPGYQFTNDLDNVPTDKKFTIHFPRSVNPQTINPSSIELVAETSGERVPLTINPLSSSEVQAVPQKTLIPGASYWLLLHPSIQYTDNRSLPTGMICTVTVRH